MEKRTKKPWLDSYDAGMPVEIDANAYASIVHVFEYAVERYPEMPAFECFGVVKSYSEIEQESRAVAAWLQNCGGIKRGDRVALMCPNTFAFPTAMLGILRAGAVQVNVNPLYTSRELGHQLNDSGAETIIIFGGSTPVLAEIIGETPLKSVIVVDVADGTDLAIPTPDVDPRLSGAVRFANLLREGRSLPFKRVELNGDDTVFFQYTGGTTGLSKGAVLSHRNLVANIEQYKAFMLSAIEPGKEIVVLALPLYHIFGLMLMLSYISVGAKGLMVPNPRDMGEFLGTIKDSRFSVMAGVNTLFTGMMLHPEFGAVDFSNLKITIGGGAPVVRETSEKWHGFTGQHIREGYGLSETSPVLCLNPLSVKEFTETCGLTVASTDIILVDAENNEVADREPGEICARGPQVMKGYWNNAKANAKAFTASGYFKTGDIGVFVDGGFLKIVDRIKDMVIVSGFNVFPNEIEATVASCPGIVECACIGVPDKKTGEALRVFAVKESNSTVTGDEVITHCRETLTGYKTPRQIVFVSELPKSNVGKILRRELRDDENTT